VTPVVSKSFGWVFKWLWKDLVKIWSRSDREVTHMRFSSVFEHNHQSRHQRTKLNTSTSTNQTHHINTSTQDDSNMDCIVTCTDSNNSLMCWAIWEHRSLCFRCGKFWNVQISFPERLKLILIP
jgi:hypothetical protein